MTGPTHVISGLAATVLLSSNASIAPTPIDLFAVILGTIAPDLDGNGIVSRPGLIFRQMIGKTLADFVDFLFGIVTTPIRLLFSHRGFLHSIFVPTVLFIVSDWNGIDCLGWFAFGYGLHLLGDAMTVAGVPAFSPLIQRRFSLRVCKTGSFVEFVFAFSMLVFTVSAGWSLLPKEVKAAHVSLFSHLNSADRGN